MMNKELMKKAHQLTKEIKAEFPEVDYKGQLGICIKFLLAEAKVEVEEIPEEKIEIKATKNVAEVASAIIECKETLSKVLNGVDFEQISFVIEDVIRGNENILGSYNRIHDRISVKADSLEEIRHTVFHELGHYVHKVMFNWKTVRLSTEHKSWYAGKNSKENFAEAFADLFSGRFKNFDEEPKRNIQMKKALGLI